MSKPPEVEKENAERWVLSYADLVTLLLGFFIILWATSDVNATKFQALARGLSEAFNVGVKSGAEGGSAIFDGGSGIIPDTATVSILQLDFESIRSQIAQGSEANGFGSDLIEVTQYEQRVVIRLADNLVFPSASAALRDEALPLLAVIGSIVAALPNEIRVEGHTDNIPIDTNGYPTNWELSSARATAVLRYLVEQGGLPAERAFAAGYGEFRPVTSNLTPEGRARNRRADIVVLYDSEKLFDAPDLVPFELDLEE